MRIFFPMALLASLGACATLSEQQCLAGDWHGIGYHDGINGQLETYISRHFNACEDSGVVPDTAAWLAGRLQGLPLYCTPANAYDIGRRGQNLRPVCSSTQQNAMFQSWDWGQEYHIISEEISTLEREQRDIERDIRFMALQDESPTIEQVLDLSGLNQRLRWIDSEIDRLELRRRRYARAPI